MDIMILIFAGIAIMHFIYDGIILPTRRMKIREELISLIDELKSYKATDKELHKELLQSATNNVNRLANVNMYSLYEYEKLKKEDPQLKTYLREKSLRLKNSEDEKLKEYAQQYGKLIARTLVNNIGMWVVYMLPVAICIALIAALGNSTVRYVGKFLALPSKYYDRAVPKQKFST